MSDDGFSAQGAIEAQLRRIPDTPLGRMCAAMVLRTANQRAVQRLSERAHCECGRLVKHRTGPKSKKKSPVKCLECRRKAVA